MITRISLVLALSCILLPGFSKDSRTEFSRISELKEKVSSEAGILQVRANWLEDGNRFWYQRKNGQFVLVNADTGEKDTTFVPEKVSPVGEFLEESKASRGGGNEIQVVFENQTDDPVSLFWVNTKGEESEYGTLAPGQTRRQHTYSRHVWAIRSEKNLKVAFFKAGADGDVALISAETLKAPPKKVSKRLNHSPDGKWEVHIKKHNVFLVNRETLKAKEFTENGVPEFEYTRRIFWSPDSTKFVVLKAKHVPKRVINMLESAPAESLQPKLHTLNYVKPGDELSIAKPHLFTLSGEEIEIVDDLFENPFGLSDFRWLPDSREFTFIYNQRGHQRLRVISVDSRAGLSGSIIEETSPTFIDYARKRFSHYIEEGHEWIWMSERDGWNHLYLYDVETGKVKNQITSGNWVVRGVDWVDEENRQIWFQAGGIYPDQNPYQIHYCRVDFDGSNLVMLTAGDGSHEVEYSPDRKYLIDTYSRVDMPPVTELRSAVDGTMIAELEKAEIAESSIPVPERFIAKGRDDETDIHGVIFRPSNFDATKTYPVIEKIYAGPHGSFVPNQYRAWQGSQTVAEFGFVVVQIDGMGTSHRSKAFHDVAWKNLKDSGFPDRIKWIKAAAEKYPSLDIERVGIYGGSAGGQSTVAAMLWHGDFYKAGVSDCGCHDNRMDKIWWNELWMGWPIDKSYEANSNVTHAHRLTGKLLLTVGELDKNVDPASTMQVVDALIKADKDFELIVVPGAGHGVGETDYMQRRRADFFVRHLQ